MIQNLDINHSKFRHNTPQLVIIVPAPEFSGFWSNLDTSSVYTLQSTTLCTTSPRVFPRHVRCDQRSQICEWRTNDQNNSQVWVVLWRRWEITHNHTIVSDFWIFWDVLQNWKIAKLTKTKTQVSAWKWMGLEDNLASFLGYGLFSGFFRCYFSFREGIYMFICYQVGP